MEENDGSIVRFRLVFDDRHLLNKLQRSQGLRRCWFLLKSGVTTIGDLANHIRESFGLHDRIVLFMDDFVLPSFESTSIITEKDIIRIKKKEIKQKDICKPCDGLNLLQDSQITRVHDLAFNNNLLADDKSQENSQGNGSYDKEILTSCMENAVHLDPPNDAGLAKRKKKRSKGQSEEINHDHEFEPSNNSDKKQARPQIVHSSDGEEDDIPSVVRFRPREHCTQQTGETQPSFFDGESSMNGQNRNKENTFPQSTGFHQRFNIDEVPIADGILPLPNPKVMSSTDNITMPPKHLVHFESLHPLRRLPVKGDILAYRYVELSSSVHSKLSSPQVGKVSSFDYRSLQIILLPVLDYEILLEDNLNGAIVQQNASRFKEDGSLEIEYLSLVDVRLLKHHDSEEACQDDPSRKDNWEEALAKGNLNASNTSTAEQSNDWAKWIPKKSATSASWSFKQPNVPLAVGRGSRRTNCAPNRSMNTWTPNWNPTNCNPNWNSNTKWNPNRINTSSTANAYTPTTPLSYRAPRAPTPWNPHHNNFFLPGGNFSGLGNQ